MVPQTAFVVRPNFCVAMICKLFWGVMAKNNTSLSEDVPQPIQSQSTYFFPRHHHELCLELKFRSHRGHDPGQIADHQQSDLSTFPPYVCYYSGMQGRDGDQVTVGCQFIKTMKRESETAMETQRPQDDQYQQEPSINHNSSGEIQKPRY